MRKSRLKGHTDHANTIYSIRTHQNLPFFMKKTANNGHFLVKSWDFLPLPYFEGAGCEKADCRDTQITQTQFTASVRTKICHFS